MITIHEEITIDLGDSAEEIITLWLVTHGTWPESDIADRRDLFLDALRRLCVRQGWLIECQRESFEI